MRKRNSIFVFLSFAALLWTALPVLAQSESGLTEQEFTPTWEQANVHFLKGKDLFAKKELNKAEAEFKACLEALPKHADARFFLAQLDYLKGDFVRALADIEGAEAAYTATTGTTNFIDAERRKTLLDERARKEQEIAFIEDVLNASPCKTEVELIRLPEAIESLRREISSLNAMLNEQPRPEPRPLPADYPYIHGNILFKMNKFQEACGQYLKAIESDPGHLRAHNNLINICYLTREYEKALKYIKIAEANGVELNPRLKEAVLQVAKK